MSGRTCAPLAAAAIAWSLLIPSTLCAQLTVGPEFSVNQLTAGEQAYPAAASTPGGRFLVVWESDGADGSGPSGGSTGVVGRLYDMTGVAQSNEFLINTYTAGTQDRPAVAWDGSSRFIVVWKSVNQDGSSSGIYGQRFNKNGSPVGTEFRLNTVTTDSQNLPAVAGDGSGGFIAVWESNNQDGSLLGIFGQRYDAAGSKAGTEFAVNTFTTGAQGEPDLAAGAAGEFVVVWRSVNQDGNAVGVFGQRFNGSGTKAGTEFQVNTETLSGQDSPSVSKDAAGNFTVAWESNGQDGSSKGVYAQRYAASGTPIGTEFRVNTYTPLSQDDVDVSCDALGNCVISWESADQDGSLVGSGVYAQRYNNTGAAVGTEFQVNTFTTDTQEDPAVAIDDAGHFVVAWRSYLQDGALGGIYAKIFSETGVVTTTTSTTTTTLPAAPLCDVAPATGCITAAAGGSSVQLMKKGGVKDLLKWKLGRGGQTARADFKDPVASGAATYRVCVYDASQKQMELNLPPMGLCAGKPCWSNSGTNGYKYKDKDATPSGVTGAKFKSGPDGKSQVSVKGKGTLLGVPTLPLTLPVTVQMLIDDGIVTNCWQVLYTSSTTNDATQLKAKGP